MKQYGERMRLRFQRITDISLFNDFHCGVPAMDRFIHDSLQWCIDYNYCHVYAIYLSDEIIAMVALSNDSLTLDLSDKEEMQAGFFPKPELSFDYQDTFWAKSNYPALEITYLAVREDKRRCGIGEFIVEAIAQKAMDPGQNIAGCQFLTVEAYNNADYNAVGFYSRCDFIAAELPNPNKETLRMFKLILPQKITELKFRK